MARATVPKCSGSRNRASSTERINPSVMVTVEPRVTHKDPRTARRANPCVTEIGGSPEVGLPSDNMGAVPHGGVGRYC